MFECKKPILHNLQGPAFQKPLFHEFIGEFSPTQHTDAYLKAIQNAMNYFHHSSGDKSLIINTHGYVSNIGENVLYDIIRIAEPDVIILLDKGSASESNDEDGYLNVNPVAIIESEVRRRTFHSRASIQNIPKNQYKGPSIWKIEVPYLSGMISHKKDKKDIMMTTYLLGGQLYSNQLFPQIPRISQLAIATPIEISFDKFIFVAMTGNQNKYFFKEEFMKCSMIFIASIISFNYSPMLHNSEYSKLQHDECQEMFIKSSSKGFGFIKDILIEKRSFLVVTPLNSSELGVVNLIVKSAGVQFSKDFFKEDSLLNVENWMKEPIFNHDLKIVEENKLFLNDCVFGVGSASYRNIKSLRKAQ